MVFCKFFFVVLLVVSIGTAVAQNHLIVGEINEISELLFSETYFQAGQRGGMTLEHARYDSEGEFLISRIRALDLAIPGQGGSAIIMAGGVGRTNVTIRLQSRVGQGYNFFVDIWGNRIN
ncbi:unnamed protein product [Diamesa tonsa]